MAIAGLGFVAKNITKVLAPAYSSELLLAPMMLNAVAVAIWMLAKGVDRAGWDRAIGDRRRGTDNPTEANFYGGAAA
jgi:hypothetical protein